MNTIKQRVKSGVTVRVVLCHDFSQESYQYYKIGVLVNDSLKLNFTKRPWQVYMYLL